MFDNKKDKVIFLTNRDQIFTNYAEVFKQGKKDNSMLNDFNIEFCFDEAKNIAESGIQAKLKVKTGNMVFVSWMGAADDIYIKQLKKELQTNNIAFAMHFTTASSDCHFGLIERQQAEMFQKYVAYGGIKNTIALFNWLANVFYGINSSYDLPQELPWTGIYHPDFSEALTLETYQKNIFNVDKPTIGILFPRDVWVWGSTQAYELIVRKIEEKGYNALAFFSHWTRDDVQGIPGFEDNFHKYCIWQGKVIISALINCMWFSLTVGRPLHDKNFLQTIGVPILHGETLLNDIEDWWDSPFGLNQNELHANVVMPEFDGVIHGIPIVGRKKAKASGEITMLPIPFGIDLLVGRAIKWARLSQKNNKEKKVAIIFHNYPPSNFNIGTAMALDSIRSVEVLLQTLQKAGYNIGQTPIELGSIIKMLTAGVTNDRNYCGEEKLAQCANRYSVRDYKQWFAQLADNVRMKMEEDWGSAPGDVFVDDDSLIIPGMALGNIFISVQPPRGFGEDPNKVYHSADVAPTHHYLAYYEWIRSVFGADAVVHVGTHGSLEWLPGKSTGLSEKCYPLLAIGDLPNIYPYLITIICEGIQAKRRAAAVIIDHLPAPTSNSGLYGSLKELEILIDDYYHYKDASDQQLIVTEDLIRTKVREAELESELGLQSTANFNEYLVKVHGYLNLIQESQTRVGLHVLGKAPENDLLIEYLLAMTKVDNGKVNGLPYIIAEILGYDYNYLCENRGSINQEDNRSFGKIIETIRELSICLVKQLAAYDFIKCDEEIWLNIFGGYEISKEDKNKLTKICRFINEELYQKLLLTTNEITNILNALNGKYIEPGPSGAPTCGMPDVLPTGRNFYGVDPRALPSRTAWLIGRELGDKVIERFIADEGHYPERIGMVFWSGNNMRTKGQCIAEFLYLLGVEPIWQASNGRVTGVKVIPVKELKRPRIDVTARISGMYRDSLPNTIDLIDEAVEAVLCLNETSEENYIIKHYLEECGELVANGENEEDAKEYAKIRLFGSQPGTYGAGVNLALENKNWESIDDLQDIYVKWGGYGYSKTIKGHFLPKLFTKQLETIEATIKNEDNYEVNMLESDDYNAFHGGMIAAVKSLSGKQPRSYCGDTSNSAKVEVRSLQEETKLLYRTEVLNPKFIEGMKNHGYKGAADLASVVSHSFQWDATSNIIDDWMYDELAASYALDKKMQDWMKEVNPWALQRIAEILLEAEQRGLWNASLSTKNELVKLFLSMEGELEERGE